MTDGNNPPSLRTDTLTQLILDWDAKDPSNPYMTIKEVIDEWENTLEDKLDIIYYFQAQQKLQEAIDEHEIENADWF